MKITSQHLKSLMIITGVLLALLLLLTHTVSAQSPKEKTPSYKCSPCGCEDDDKLVHGPGNCQTCGMSLINTLNPSEGLNYMNITASQLCNLIQANPDLLLLDVRSKPEFEGKVSQLGHFKMPSTSLFQRSVNGWTNWSLIKTRRSWFTALSVPGVRGSAKSWQTMASPK